MPLSGHRHQRGELLFAEGPALGGALHLDEAAAAGLDDVHVDVGGRVLLVVEVEQDRLAHLADRDGGHVVGDRQLGGGARAALLAQALDERDEGAGDRGAARAAVGLQHVAVDPDRALAERLHVDHRAQRAADQALDLVGAARRAALRDLARHARVGGARQHPVLRGHPALALALEERRHLVLEAHGADDAGVAELDEARALGVLQEAGRELDRPELRRAAAVGAHPRLALEHLRVDLRAEVGHPEAHGRGPSTAGAGALRARP